MGREAFAVCHWRGDPAEARALLEASHIILRGAIRLRVERSAIDAMARDDGDLILTIGGERLILELGAAEAKRWHDHLLKPLPMLAEKLGIDGAHRAFVIGTYDDAELARALDDKTTSDPNEASVVIAILMAEADMAAAIAVAQTKPERHLWCVSGKGKFATLSDSTIRANLRAWLCRQQDERRFRPAHRHALSDEGVNVNRVATMRCSSPPTISKNRRVALLDGNSAGV